MKKNHFLITGCGHQGTGWMARAMNLLGHSTGHEWVFDYNESPRWANLDGESAWPAAPFIDQIDGPLAVMHLTRHPMDVVASIYNSNFLRSNCTCGHPQDAHRAEPYVQFILRRFPDLWDITPDEVRSVAWVLMWNRLVETKAHSRFYRRFKIEELSSDPAELVRGATFLTGITATEGLAAEVQSMIPPNFNSHRGGNGSLIEMRDVPPGYWKDQFLMLIDDYGYGDRDGSQ